MTYPFNFPVPEGGLESARVKLVAFDPHLHGPELYSILAANPDIHQYIPVTIDADFLEEHILKSSDAFLFAVVDKTRGNGFAGIIGLLHATTRNLSAEIGPVICFPAYQRTFVTSNAVGLLMQYCLDTSEQGGLGLRRLQWTANSDNLGSVALAKKMGLNHEGTMRWTWILPEGRPGRPVSSGRGAGLGRDSALLATYWDEWEQGGRDHVQRVMDRGL
ncbi:unnamed protein product [Mycena citricolor]|uniref:N-acetyltransferase domain-containing protein n=1 Tax=Mycena citricolor TaxID=2018698 RepID=A0AAD2K4T0_9AGAR|nr:unnamed protein product [Mycena citricolor]